ncbi:MAG TPA: adenosylcobinamide-phosphate synthase CbiB [Nitrospira sp.]|nr:adenosylcobinamide-phosphate synthase CbiB [Nitrospira sp.]
MMPGDLLLACLLDAVIGDPRWAPHPVRWMGSLIDGFEKQARAVFSGPSALRVAGVVLAVGLPSAAFLAGWTLIAVGAALHEWVGRTIEICLASTTLAWRDLVDHVGMVTDSLKAGSLADARRAVGMIVGRDTDRLPEPEIVRATVETVAESASDGVIAPLLCLAVGGAPLALAYKAISTLDSMVGHRDERYRDLGWASARLDDLVNWIPARVTAWLTVAAAGLVGWGTAHVTRSATVLWRDGRKHPSPNSGRPEAAMAGALGVRLGGLNFYDRIPYERPRLGDAVEDLSIEHIERAKWMMTVAYLLGIIMTVGYRWS